MIFESIQSAEFQFVHSNFFGELIVGLFLGYGALRHTKPPESAGRNKMRVNSARLRTIVRNFVWAGTVDGHAGGDGGSPGSVSAGVELAFQIHGQQFSIGGGAGATTNFRRMSLGGAADGFGARVNH